MEPADPSPETATTDPESRALTNTDDEPRVVLAAVDTSPAAQRVISFAARFVRAFPRATLHVLHVLRHSRLDRPYAGAPALSSEQLADAKDHLDYHKRLASRQCNNPVIGHFTTGNPTSEILRTCDELDVDLLVIATHDHAGFERLLLGSIAETLMRKAPCTVTVVRQNVHGRIERRK
ncbi:MAG TPA: universal stress protein [Polyangiaceae bacterium]|nr:universal stress protein [Polyangiaceae bacterium]